MTYINTVKYLLSLANDEDAFSDSSALERMRLACENLEISLQNFKCVHICGDEGKESCSRMLTSILENASYKVGLYSLPSSDDFRSCLFSDKKSISHSDFAEIITYIYKFYRAKFKNVVPHRREIMTLAAIIYFQKQGCESA